VSAKDIIKWSVGIVASAIGLISGLWWVSQFITPLFAEFIIPSESGVVLQADTYSLPQWFGFAAIVSVFIIFVLLMLFIFHRSISAIFHKSSVHDENFLLHNSKKLVNQFYSSEVPPIDFEEINYTCNVTKNLDGFVSQKLKVRAVSETAHFWTFWIRGDEESGTIKSISDLDLHVVSKGKDTDVSVLPIAKEGKRCRFVVFFLPAIGPDNVREIEIEYKWPRFFGKFEKSSEVNYDLSYRTKSPDCVCDLYFRIEFPAELGKLACVTQGSPIDTTHLHDIGRENRAIWEYGPVQQNISRMNFDFLFKRQK
jgi:hypothetical protein